MSKFKIITQFLKDISFESPNVPDLFFKQDNGQGKIEMKVDVQIKSADNNVFMVDLITRVHSKLEKDDKTVFLIESNYSGLVQLEEEKDEEAKKRTLLIDVPAMLFPSVRALVTRLTAESGMAPFAMQPVDFVAMYEQQAQKSQPANNK